MFAWHEAFGSGLNTTKLAIVVHTCYSLTMVRLSRPGKKSDCHYKRKWAQKISNRIEKDYQIIHQDGEEWMNSGTQEVSPKKYSISNNTRDAYS